MIKKTVALLAILLGVVGVYAQELNCTVEINTDKINGTDKAVFSTLQTAITEYMNNTQWGNAQFLVNEKIDCKLFFTIASVEGT